MNKEELEKNKFIQTLIKKTPNGGDYSEAHFFDKNWEYTTKEYAVHVIIKEFASDGTLLHETFMDKKTSHLRKSV